MSQNRKAFLLGVFVTLFVMGLLFLVSQAIFFQQTFSSSTNDTKQQAEKVDVASQYPPITQDAVRIKSLPPLHILRDSPSFTGKKNFPQKIMGQYAQNIQIVSFNAQGENAHKSTLKILWEDGTTDIFYPGTTMSQLPSGKRAKAITISGYCVHERKILPDLSRTGKLDWEIYYETGN